MGLLISLIHFSCSTEENNSNIDEEKINFVLKARNAEVTKAAYQLLNSEEKYHIWNERIEYILTNEKLNQRQITFLDELKTDLNSSIFNENSVSNKNFKKKYNNDRLSIFHPVQGYYYFGTLTSMSKNGTWASISIGGGSKIGDFYAHDFSIVDQNDGTACTCNMGSIVNPGCDKPCPTSKQKNSGCGFIWVWECNGYM